MASTSGLTTTFKVPISIFVSFVLGLKFLGELFELRGSLVVFGS